VGIVTNGVQSANNTSHTRARYVVGS